MLDYIFSKVQKKRDHCISCKHFHACAVLHFEGQDTKVAYGPAGTCEYMQFYCKPILATDGICHRFKRKEMNHE